MSLGEVRVRVRDMAESRGWATNTRSAREACGMVKWEKGGERIKSLGAVPFVTCGHG